MRDLEVPATPLFIPLLGRVVPCETMAHLDVLRRTNEILACGHAGAFDGAEIEELVVALERYEHRDAAVMLRRELVDQFAVSSW